jgi:hypothetical protein
MTTQIVVFPNLGLDALAQNLKLALVHRPADQPESFAPRRLFHISVPGWIGTSVSVPK